MAGAKPIFRKKSLERLSTPDRLDQLLRVVKRRMWLPLLALGGLLAVALAWCFLGRVPVTADATAVLVYPQSVVPLQAKASGELLELLIQVDQTVEKDQPIAVLGRKDLRDELALQRDRLAQFQLRAGLLSGFSEKQVQREKALYAGQCERLEARIDELDETARKVRKETRKYNDEQRENLEHTQKKSEELDTALEARFDSYEDLLDEGYTSKDMVVAAKQRWVANQLALADVAVRLQELDLRVIKADAVYESQMDHVDALRIQLEQAKLRLYEADMRLAEAEVRDQTGEAEIQLTIQRLEDALSRRSIIKADRAGKVLEVIVSRGSMVTAGQRLALVATTDPDQELVALAYFDNAAGKQIEAAKKVGRPLPARVAPAHVQPQRDGSLLGAVEKVSPYPRTAEAVVTQVGNREMARMLVGDQSRIEVEIALHRDEESRALQWTSGRGPSLDVPITAGTTAQVRVTLEERAPITLLIPVLRGWLGLD